MLVTTTWRIRRHIKQEIFEGRAVSDDPLASQELDSLGLEQLVTYLQAQYDVVLADGELVAENFASIPVLAKLIENKRRQKRASKEKALAGAG